MIDKISGYNSLLEFNEEENSYSIFSYQRIVLTANSQQYISLPYKRKEIGGKYINFELDKNLCQLGLICLWNNLNEKDSKINLTLLLKNSNIVFKEELTPLNSIIGKNKIDIIPNSLLGKIFI